MAERRPDLPRECGDGGFAARPGDRGNDRGLARKKLRRDQRQRAARVAGVHESGGVGPRDVRVPFRDDRDSAGGDGSRNEVKAVGLAAGNRHENIAALDRAAVGRHAGDLKIGIAGSDVAAGRQNVAKSHGGPL